MEVSRHRFFIGTLLVVIFEALMQMFRNRLWGASGDRGIILLLGLAVLGSLPILSQRLCGTESARPWRRNLLWALLAIALLWNLVVTAIAIGHTARTGSIRLDQGQATYNAALGLRRGENPYGPGAILDFYSYFDRMPERQAAALGPTIPANQVGETLTRYWSSLDPTLRVALLPPPPANASASARREYQILGYKYGPVPVVVTAFLEPILGHEAVVLVNAIETWGFFILVALILQRRLGGTDSALLALLAVLLDHFPTWYYIHFSCSDIWPLFFCTLGVYALLRGWMTILGLALALALGCKMFPAVLYLPLLIQARSWRATLVCLGGTVAIFLPLLIWDREGLALNFFLWPAFMHPDGTSWLDLASTPIVSLARISALALAGVLLLRLALGFERRLFWTLAMANMAIVMVGTVIHDNYVPWFSIWSVCAIAEAFSVPRELPIHARFDRMEFA